MFFHTGMAAVWLPKIQNKSKRHGYINMELSHQEHPCGQNNVITNENFWFNNTVLVSHPESYPNTTIHHPEETSTKNHRMGHATHVRDTLQPLHKEVLSDMGNVNHYQLKSVCMKPSRLLIHISGTMAPSHSEFCFSTGWSQKDTSIKLTDSK